MSSRQPRGEAVKEPTPTNVETRLKAALAKRQNDLIESAAMFVRHRTSFAGPAEYIVMLKKFYRLGFEDACK